MTPTTNLNNNNSSPNDRTHPREFSDRTEDLHYEPDAKTRGIIWGVLSFIFIVALVFLLFFQHLLGESFYPWLGLLPGNATLAALAILDNAPVIDGHIDLPILARMIYGNNASAIDLESPMPYQVDIPRLRKGKVGGFFWSTYVSCADPEDEGRDFTIATWRVRDTLEQIDVAKMLIAKYPDTFQLALGSEDIKSAIIGGKIASLLGVEGGHQLGNSIAVLRQYHALGVRYLTLTHVCHNAFADSCGLYPRKTPLHGGLSPLGRFLIKEMNRLGMIVDLSHTSDATAIQALTQSRAPVIWSHSSSRAVYYHPRNVPDKILRMIGTNEGQRDAVVMVNFAANFVAAPQEADVDAVADHVEHIAKVAGKQHVGLGSDFDGIEETPRGLEDVSKYPALIAELYRRGWDRYELAGLTGANLLRVLEGVEKVARDLHAEGASPAYDLYKKRTDIPSTLRGEF